jgi:superfamily II DNA or RNA helicase
VIDPRPYQRAAHDETWSRWDDGRQRLAVIHPTGTGKTITGGLIARTARDRGLPPSLFLVGNLFLLEQWSGAMDACGLSWAVEQGSQRARDATYFGRPPDCVLAMWQSMQGDRLASWPADAFGQVVVDEGHHWFSPSHQAIDRHFTAPRRLVLTATPDRVDGGDIRAHFEIAHEYPVREAIRDRWIKKVSIEKLPCDVDLRAIRTVRRADGSEDLDPKELSRLLAPHLNVLCNAAVDRLGDRPAICFTPDVLCATAAADAFRKLGVAAEWVSGDRPDKERVIREYRAGEFQVLCNAELTKEGFDAPRCSAIILFRMTKSRALLSQMIGRGFRLNGLYDDCLVLDPGCIFGKLKPVHPAEVLCPDASAAVLARAIELIDSGEEADPEEAEKLARQQIDDEARAAAEAAAIRQELSVSVQRKQVSYRVIAYDPFPLLDPGSIGLCRGRGPRTERDKAPSAWQRETLQGEFGFGSVDTLSQPDAGRLIGELRVRQMRGQASWDQVAYLVEAGMPPAEAKGLSAREAERRIDGLEGRQRA